MSRCVWREIAGSHRHRGLDEADEPAVGVVGDRLFDRGRQLFGEALVQDGSHQVRLGGEVPVERPDTYIGMARNFFQWGIGPMSS